MTFAGTVIPVFLIGVSVTWYAIYAKQLLLLPNASRLQKLLGIIFCWWGLSTLKDLLSYAFPDQAPATVQHIYYTDACGAVTFALFLMELTSPGWVTKRRTLLLLLPFLLFFFIHFYVQAAWFHTLFTFFFVCFALIAVGVAIFKSRYYAHLIRETYSSLDDVDISGVWSIVSAFTVCQLVWWAVSGTLNSLADSLYYTSSLVCWSLVMRHVNRLRSLRLPQYTETTDTEHVTAPSKRYALHLAGRLETLMDEEPLYLNPDLTLGDLVQRLNTNRTYLSDYISQQLGTTFYDYINQLRIERKVIPMMESGEPFTLEYVAVQAGFKNLATFRRAFKKLTGVLPSHYQRQKS